jgi:hypothetical protein
MGELSTSRLAGIGSRTADDVTVRRPPVRSERRPSQIEGAAAGLASRWDLVLFCLGLLGIAFAYGVAVGKYQVFPHTELNRAADALKDWRENWRHYLGFRSRYLLPTARADGGVTVFDRKAASPGYTFLTMYRDGRYGASLLDLDGRTLHTWDVAFSDAFPEPEHLEAVPPDTDVSMHGAELLPNGDLILSFGMLGAARIDRCSQVRWAVPAFSHHALDHLPDGSTLVLASRRYEEHDSPFPRLGPGPAGYLWDDTVLRVRPNGSVAEERSVLQTIYDSGWQGMLFVGSGGTVIRDHDPLHTNDVEVLRDDMAAAFPQFEAGDVMLSLRNINSVIVVDGETWRIKWKMTGPFLMQHDPDFLPNGNIMVFDNRITGSQPQFGYSRILEIDPATREVVWSYEGTDQEPFYTDHGGVQQLLPNGNVLVVETQGGRVFEVARGSSERVVWEYVNLQEPGFVGSVSGAERIDAGDLDFIGRSCAGSLGGELAESYRGM